MEKKSVKKNYYGLDVFKFIAALLVVAIHVPPFNSPILLFTKIAVPFFAIVSSFLFFKSNPDTKKLYNYILRIIKLLLFWSILFSPFIIKTNKYYLLSNFKDQFLAIISDFLLRNFLTGSWFFIWLIYTTVVVFYLRKLLSDIIIFFTSCVVYLYFLLSYNKLFPQSLDIFYNSWLINVGYYWMGFPFIFIFISLGLLLSKSQLRKSKRFYFSGLVISLIVMVFVKVFIRGFIDIPLVFIEYYLFSFLINCDISYSPVYKKLRGASVIIFCTHFVIAYGIITKQRIENSFLLYFVTVFFGLVLSFGIFKLEEYKYFKWLKFIY